MLAGVIKVAASVLVVALTSPDVAAEKRLLWGDTHLHSSFSFDAFLNDNLRADPATAYRFAMGQPVEHPYHGARVQLDRPLDFLAVSDHAEFLGLMPKLYYEGPNLAGLGPWQRLKAQVATSVIRHRVDARRGRELFAPALPEPRDAREAAAALVAGSGVPESLLTTMLPRDDAVERGTWERLVDAADAFYRPGEFTTLIGWEWSSSPGGANLHRIVLSDADATVARRFDPFGFDDSPYPEDLWAFLERTSAATGADFVAIPHNSNISKGVMFDELTLRGATIDADYARRRLRWESVAEITQIKGDSETHPVLSPRDEFADFETYPYYIQRRLEGPYVPRPGDYLRSALKRGLELERRIGLNPYRLGFIGSTDAHSGLSSADEDNFHGKMATDSIPANKRGGFGNPGGTSGWAMSASGLAAVWAEDNTREAILAAIRRREVYATTGPRISLRFHAGYLAAGEAQSVADPSALMDRVPMGGALDARGTSAPVFFAEALKDPAGVGLDRLQVVKGWIDDDGRAWEQVIDIALSDEGRRRADGSITPVADTVDRRSGRLLSDPGAAVLTAAWRDPDFDPSQSAFYYLRVLQVPTARHSLLDAIALGETAAAGQPDTIQERAYSSPIWVRPDEANQ